MVCVISHQLHILPFAQVALHVQAYEQYCVGNIDMSAGVVLVEVSLFIVRQ